jgi:hypothetical protein
MVMGISEYLKGKSGKPFFLVQGGAGTGKSFSINRALLEIQKHVIAAAPSHFAKMCSKILGPRYTVTTIAGLLKSYYMIKVTRFWSE